MNNHYIKVRTSCNNYNKFILKLYKINIEIFEIKYNKNIIELKIYADDFKKLKKSFALYKFEKIKDYGIYDIKNKINANKILIFCVILGLILLYFFSNVIIKVNVIHSKKEIRELVYDALEQRGIKRLTLKKDYDELEKIKEEILNEYPDKLEWIEIEVNGMVYNVRIEQRIITELPNEKKACNIVASKSGIITKMITYKGENVQNISDYISKGDILISGDIKVGEEIKDVVCADGKVFAETWYTVNVSLPLNYKTKTKTGKMRYNFMLENYSGEHVILRSRLKNKVIKKNKIFSLLNNNLYLEKEYEILEKSQRYSIEEAQKECLKLAKNKINVKLNDKERIIDEKVLKKTVNDSTMNMEVFISVEEQVGVLQEYEGNVVEENSNVWNSFN